MNNEKYIVDALYTIDQLEDELMSTESENISPEKLEQLRERARELSRCINKLNIT